MSISSKVKVFKYELKKIEDSFIGEKNPEKLHRKHMMIKELCIRCIDDEPEFLCYYSAKRYPVLVLNDAMSYLLNNKPKHGGVRKGAGRPKKKKTVQVRIPESLVAEISKLKDCYPNLDSEDKLEISNQLKNLVHFARLNSTP